MADDVLSPPADAPAAPAAAPAPAPAPAAAPATALGSGSQAAPPPPQEPGAAPPVAAPAADDPHAWLPQKLRVFAADGKTLDMEASAKKLGEAYGHAEKRIGSGDVPPQEVAGYKVNVPEAMTGKIDAEVLAADPMLKDFLGKAHTAGLTQKQLDVVLGEYLGRAAKAGEAAPQIAAVDCEATLRQQDGWKTDAEYQANIGAAFRAGKSIFGADFDGIERDYGNDPRLIRGLASIAKEMNEDMPASAEAQTQMQDSLDSLLTSPAYLDARNPQHAAVVAKVSAMQARLVGTRAVAGGKTYTFKT